MSKKPRYGPLTERELDIAESIYTWVLLSIINTSRTSGAPGTVICNALLKADDARQHLRDALEAEEARPAGKTLAHKEALP